MYDHSACKQNKASSSPCLDGENASQLMLTRDRCVRSCSLNAFDHRRKSGVCGRVAKWHIFKPEIWVNFGGSCNGRCWYTYFMTIGSYLRPFGIFCRHLVYFVAIWYSL
jgi:hypothetical protein